VTPLPPARGNATRPRRGRRKRAEAVWGHTFVFLFTEESSTRCSDIFHSAEFLEAKFYADDHTSAEQRQRRESFQSKGSDPDGGKSFVFHRKAKL
jgi:hypothetical protein